MYQPSSYAHNAYSRPQEEIGQYVIQVLEGCSFKYRF